MGKYFRHWRTVRKATMEEMIGRIIVAFLMMIIATLSTISFTDNILAQNSFITFVMFVSMVASSFFFIRIVIDSDTVYVN